MKQKYEEFRKKCYEKYQLNWMLSHGYSLQDLIDAMNEKYIEDDSREYTTPGCYYEDVLDNDGFHSGCISVWHPTGTAASLYG